MSIAARLPFRVLFLCAAAGLGTAQIRPPGWRIYPDAKERFDFAYPEEFGMTSPGTDDGFGDRIAAIRFSEFSAGVSAGGIILGGEAVLNRAFPQLDLQAAGGLYDHITLQIFPAAAAAAVQKVLPILTADNLCDALGREEHLRPTDPRLTPLTVQLRDTIPKVDSLGNAAPKIFRCAAAGGTVTFDKESGSNPGGARRHIYGAVRFLGPPYSTFQLIRGQADAPPAELLDRMTAVVNSWRAR